MNGSCDVRGEGWDNTGLAQLEGGGDDAAPSPGEVVAIGAADRLEQAMHAQALHHAGELRAAAVREESAEIGSGGPAPARKASPRCRSNARRA